MWLMLDIIVLWQWLHPRSYEYCHYLSKSSISSSHDSFLPWLSYPMGNLAKHAGKFLPKAKDFFSHANHLDPNVSLHRQHHISGGKILGSTMTHLILSFGEAWVPSSQVYRLANLAFEEAHSPLSPIRPLAISTSFLLPCLTSNPSSIFVVNL